MRQVNEYIPGTDANNFYCFSHSLETFCKGSPFSPPVYFARGCNNTTDHGNAKARIENEIWFSRCYYVPQLPITQIRRYGSSLASLSRIPTFDKNCGDKEQRARSITLQFQYFFSIRTCTKGFRREDVFLKFPTLVGFSREMRIFHAAFVALFPRRRLLTGEYKSFDGFLKDVATDPVL